MVRQIYREYGEIGFEYDMNMNQNKSKPKPKGQKRGLKADGTNPKKKQKISESGNAAKAKTKGTLAAAWRWSPPRRTVAVSEAVKNRLFDIGVANNKRDSKIDEIVKNINGMKEIDVNFALLTSEHYRKEIYKIQRKVLKLGVADEQSILLLPKEEQDLFKQLKEAGEVKEASLTTMSADSCLVHFLCLSRPNGPSPNLQYLFANFRVTLRANENNSLLRLQGLSLMNPNSLSTSSLSLLNTLFQRAHTKFVCDCTSLNGARILICSVGVYPKSAPTYSPSFVKMPGLFQYEFRSILWSLPKPAAFTSTPRK